MRLSKLGQIWRIHFLVALLVGIILGTGIGLGESISVLFSQGLLGRYDELVAWAIIIDASALLAVEFGLAIISGLFFSLMQLVPSTWRLVAFQLGETIFVAALARGIWSQITVDPSRIIRDPLGVVFQPALTGLLLGEGVLAGTTWTMERIPIIRRLHIRYWLILEAVIVALAIAFGLGR